MSEEIVNQLTLNCLISQNQLVKLNKKRSDQHNNSNHVLFLKYKDEIQNLFLMLLSNDLPPDLIYDVRVTYQNFIDKCLYYLPRSTYFNEKKENELDNENQTKPYEDINKNSKEEHNLYDEDEEEEDEVDEDNESIDSLFTENE